MNTYVHSALINPDFVHHNGKLGGGGTRPGATPSDARGSTAYTAEGQKISSSSPAARAIAAATSGRRASPFEPGSAPETGGGFPVRTVAIVGGGVVVLGLASFFVIRFLRR
jgi:hypothetical protein